jgi:aspartate ammonia-lyase
MRREHDLLGDMDVDASVYFGVHTLRAVENFPITGITLADFPEMIIAIARVKQASALANRDLGLLSDRFCEAITKACERIIAGEFHDQFVVDMIQGGAGTSTNMNANEVIANIAIESLGGVKGNYELLHPNEHVNLSQSTNDVYPTAVKLALMMKIEDLLLAMAHLRQSFERKATEFHDLVKIGRTQLQDAVPMTLGQEFSTYGVMLGEDEERLRETLPLLSEINLGATAIGTGINAPHGYAPKVCAALNGVTGRHFVTAFNLVEATQDVGVFVQLSGVLKRVAVKLSKTCNDLRLLSSGPRAGFGEISLPPMQAGSSIMPGKVNPVIPEVVNQVAFVVIGHDATVTFAAEGGQLQLNAFEPIIAFSLLKSLRYMERACRILADRCIDGITANRDRLDEIIEHSLAIVTALNPKIGYEKATEVAMTAHRTGKTIRETVLSLGYLSEAELDGILNIRAMIGDVDRTLPF